MWNLSYLEIMEPVTMEFKKLLCYQLHHILQYVLPQWYVIATSQTLEISQYFTSRNIRIHAQKGKKL